MKRIVLCADGTGNKGGYTPDSNVYKIHNAVRIHNDEQCESAENQIIYYDNGVGTATNKIWRAITGAFGFGFKRNVCELYQYLARNYQPAGDDGSDADEVFIFGFSRGAATVRAFNGFVHTCGLVDGRGLSVKELQDRVEEEYQRYKQLGRQGKSEAKPKAGKSHGVVPIKFLGVWDSVSALGFPKRTDTTGIFSWLLNGIFNLADYISDKIWSHNFYNYALTDNLEYACQALAIDDARTAFWPLVWDESGRNEGSVEQVWFAGVHSNVGGGYERQGLANVALDWMMVRAAAHGLKFKEGTLQQAKADSHVHGHLYDSRDGVGVFYRFHPRQITELHKLSGGKEQTGKIRIHDSVIERMYRETADYAPTHLPGKFHVVRTSLNPDSMTGETVGVVDLSENTQWQQARSSVDTNVLWRKRAYMAMLTSTLIVGVAAVYFWWWAPPPISPDRSGIHGHIADVLNYFLPDLFSGLIEVSVIQSPHWFWGVLAFALILKLVNDRIFRRGTHLGAVRLRKILLSQLERQG